MLLLRFITILYYYRLILFHFSNYYLLCCVHLSIIFITKRIIMKIPIHRNLNLPSPPISHNAFRVSYVQKLETIESARGSLRLKSHNEKKSATRFLRRAALKPTILILGTRNEIFFSRIRSVGEGGQKKVRPVPVASQPQG